MTQAEHSGKLHEDGMREDSKKIPNPRSVEMIRQANEDWIDFKDAIIATVPLLPSPGKSVRVQLMLDERLLARIDAVAKNRSAFLAQAATQVLERITDNDGRR